MGVSGLEVAAAELVAHGKPATTPVAIVESGFPPAQRTTVGHAGDDRRTGPPSATCSPRPSSSSARWWTCTRSWGDPARAGRGRPRQPGPGGCASPPRTLVAAVRRARPGLTVLEAYLDHAAPALSDARRHADRAVRRGPAAAGRGLPQPGRHPGRALARRCPGDPGRRARAGPAAGARAGATARRGGRRAPATATRRWSWRRRGRPRPAPSTRCGRSPRGGATPAGGPWNRPSGPPPSPTVESAVATLRGRGAPRVAVATYLLFPGLFADKLAAAGADVVSAPLASAPEVVELVLARYDAAVTGRARRRTRPTHPPPAPACSALPAADAHPPPAPACSADSGSAISATGGIPDAPVARAAPSWSRHLSTPSAPIHRSSGRAPQPVPEPPRSTS